VVAVLDAVMVVFLFVKKHALLNCLIIGGRKFYLSVDSNDMDVWMTCYTRHYTASLVGIMVCVLLEVLM